MSEFGPKKCPEKSKNLENWLEKHKKSEGEGGMDEGLSMGMIFNKNRDGNEE